MRIIREKIQSFYAPHLKRRIKSIFLIVLLLFFAVIALRELSSTPRFEEIIDKSIGSDQILLASDGEALQVSRTDFQRRRLNWFPLAKMSIELKKAVVEAEDRRFFSHWGVDIFSMARAAWAWLKGYSVQGASTITMQLTDLIQEEVLIQNKRIHKGSWWHKLQQLLRTPLIELGWQKDQILEAYLNLIHLRGEYQGMPAASYAFFNKHPIAIGRNEAVVLASLISAPNQSIAQLRRRSCLLLTKINQEEFGPSKKTTCQDNDTAIQLIQGKARGSFPWPAQAPHLARRLFGDFPQNSIVPSYLNRRIQSAVSSILNKNISLLQKKNVRDSAAIVIENATGRVLAYVGSVSLSTSPHVDGIEALRQAGSTLKPFIYGHALDRRILTAASILSDDPTTISWNGHVYRPSNYSRNFYGDVTVREALGSSLNVPAIKVVTMLGLSTTYQLFKSLHFSGLRESGIYGVSMALGSIDVRLDELANAYRSLANKGVWSPLRWSPIEESDPPKGLKAENLEESILSEPAAFILSDILSDPNARSIGFGWDSPLETRFWTAVKTGTSRDYRDNWCLGFSEYYTVGVWSGNFNAEAMNKVSGVSGAGTSWREIMEFLHRNQSSQPPPVPSKVVSKLIRHQWRSQFVKEYFIEGTDHVHDVVETSEDKRVQFVFPAEGSTLIKDPKIDRRKIALHVRFKGSVPENSILKMNGKILGIATNPFKLAEPPLGKHQLSIETPLGKNIATVQFLIRGE